MFGIANTRFADRTGRVYDRAVVSDELIDPAADAEAIAARWLLQQ